MATVTNPQYPQSLAPLLPNVSIPGAEPARSWLSTLGDLYYRLTPLLNLLLSGQDVVRLAPSYPVGEQLTGLTRYRRALSAFQSSLEKEKRDIENAIRGIYISSGIAPEQLLPGTPAGEQISNMANEVINLYPLLFVLAPGLIEKINPRSSLSLAFRLADLFSRYTTLADPKQLAQYAQYAADKILHDEKLHQGFTAAEIGDIAAAAVRRGLVNLRNPEKFTEDLTGALKLIAPLRDAAQMEGIPFNADEAAEIAAVYAQRYPTMDNDQIALELRRDLELKRRGGEYGSLTLLPAAAEYIRRSGVPLRELERQHEELKESAANSIFGSALGAIAKAVETGMVSRNSPAGQVYARAMAGLPLGFVHPSQFFSVLVRSGVNPQVASTMMLTPEESSYWLKPQMLASLRATQFHADWAPLFAMTQRMFPGNDPSSRAMREAMLSRYVRNAGYKNVHHFLALHGDAISGIPQLRDLALQAAAKQESLAGYKNAPWSGLARATATLQDIGRGARAGKYSLRDLLESGAQIYEYPETVDKDIGLQSPLSDSPAKRQFWSDIEDRVRRLMEPSTSHIPVTELYSPTKREEYVIRGGK